MYAKLSKELKDKLLSGSAEGITPMPTPGYAKMSYDKVVFTTDRAGVATVKFYYQDQEMFIVGPVRYALGDSLTITGIEGHQDITVT